MFQTSSAVLLTAVLILTSPAVAGDQKKTEIKTQTTAVNLGSLVWCSKTAEQWMLHIAKRDLLQFRGLSAMSVFLKSNPQQLRRVIIRQNPLVLTHFKKSLCQMIANAKTPKDAQICIRVLHLWYCNRP